jgi:hypothetical protein
MDLAADGAVDINSFASTALQRARSVLAQDIRHCFERRREGGMKLAGVNSPGNRNAARGWE